MAEIEGRLVDVLVASPRREFLSDSIDDWDWEVLGFRWFRLV